MVETLRRRSDQHMVLDEKFYTASRSRILITVDGLRTSLVRRLYELTVGPLEMRYLLRVCDVALCINPNHHIESHAPRLASATYRPGQKPRRNPTPPHNALKTHCPYGHEYSEDNTYWQTDQNGHRHRSCKTCRRNANAQYQARRRKRTHAG